MLAIISPMANESSEAVMNHAMALPNTRPTAPASPMWAMPTTSVENTRGPINILIRRRKTSETTERYPAYSVAAALSGAVRKMVYPTSTPKSIASRIHPASGSLTFMENLCSSNDGRHAEAVHYGAR
ncbi:hypothetical protein D3C77_492290 [compost metagenome]